MTYRFDGLKLRQLREKRGLRRESIAVSIDKSSETVANYEKGRSAPHLSVVSDLCVLLDCKPEDLFTKASR